MTDELLTSETQAEDGSVGEDEITESAPESGISEELMDELRKANIRFREAETAHSDAKDIASMRKKSMESAQEHLNEIVSQIVGDSLPMPLFDLTGGFGEAWRDVPLDTLGIKPGLLKAMAENDPPILTIGDQADWTKDKGDFWAKDIKDVGKDNQDGITGPIDAYWSEHPEFCDGLEDGGPENPEPAGAEPDPAAE